MKIELETGENLCAYLRKSLPAYPARMIVELANARLPFVGQGFIRAGDLFGRRVQISLLLFVTCR